MTAHASRNELWSLETLVKQYGPLELQQPLSKEVFRELAECYPELRMERESNGITTIMSPVNKGSSRRESMLHGLLFLWNIHNGHGEVFGPNGTYDLPNGATKMPDVSWISPARLAQDAGDEEAYIQVVPDFVAEIRSTSDKKERLLEKMALAWQENGVRLAWLIDPYEEKAYIFRSGQSEPEVVKGFEGKILSGEEVMPGFEFPLDTMRRKL